MPVIVNRQYYNFTSPSLNVLRVPISSTPHGS